MIDRNAASFHDQSMLSAQKDATPALMPGAHFGAVKSVRRIGSLILAESRYSPNLKTPRHSHETASFTMVSFGSYREEFSQKRFECSAGGVLYRPAGEVHRDAIGNSGAHCLMVEMPAEWTNKLTGVPLDHATISAPRHSRYDAGIAYRLRRELALGDEFSPFVVEALAIELACEMRRASETPDESPRWLLQLRERIEEEFARLPSLSLLADELGVHPGHMARAFRGHFGCTIGEYARRRKIGYCCECLRDRQVDLCDLAIRAGFSSQAHMTRMFKSQMAMTPGQYRRLHRTN